MTDVYLLWYKYCMPRKPTEHTTELARWCQAAEPEISITQLQTDTGLAYRTCHLAFHGYKVSYDTAVILNAYTAGKVSIQSLCDRPSRSKYVHLSGEKHV